MKRYSVSDVLAGANAAMVGPDFDVTGALASMVAGVASALSARAAAILVEVDGDLEVLAATSHRTLDLEIHQAQTGRSVDEHVAVLEVTMRHLTRRQLLEQLQPLIRQITQAGGLLIAQEPHVLVEGPSIDPLHLHDRPHLAVDEHP